MQPFFILNLIIQSINRHKYKRIKEAHKGYV